MGIKGLSIMPKNGKLKPRIRENKVSIIWFYPDWLDHTKKYQVSMCSNCITKFQNKYGDNYDKSRHGYRAAKYNSINRLVTPAIRSDWKADILINPLKKLTCDFCSGKYNPEFFMNP